MKVSILIACLSGLNAFAQSTHSVTVNIQGMDSYVGQMFKARFVEAETAKQVAETTLAVIAFGNFTLQFNLEHGNAYLFDFFVDANGDKAYSAPPLDHAWRMSVPPLHGSLILTFAHTLIFTDVKYPDKLASISSTAWKKTGRSHEPNGAYVLINAHEGMFRFNALGRLLNAGGR